MGFKDLANFNDALLAKQAWRLLHNKNSLFYRVFKPRFFPDCSVLEATDSTLGSHAQRSILKGRDVLLQGARWRVGGGESISIWNDAQLPSIDHPKILSQVVPGFEDAKVSDLINPIQRRWESDLIRGLFLLEEAELILSIPLNYHPTEDKVIWPYNSSVAYSVKSGKKFLAKENNISTPWIDHEHDEDIWKWIWRLSISNKVRNFLWRACHNAIPVKQNLWKRKILTEDLCEHCHLTSETVCHALWKCSKIDEVQEGLHGFEFRQLQNFQSFKDLIAFVHAEEENLELMAMVMQTIWHRRNQIKVSSRDFPISQVLP